MEREGRDALLQRQKHIQQQMAAHAEAATQELRAFMAADATAPPADLQPAKRMHLLVHCYSFFVYGVILAYEHMRVVCSLSPAAAAQMLSFTARRPSHTCPTMLWSTSQCTVGSLRSAQRLQAHAPAAAAPGDMLLRSLFVSCHVPLSAGRPVVADAGSLRECDWVRHEMRLRNAVRSRLLMQDAESRLPLPHPTTTAAAAVVYDGPAAAAATRDDSTSPTPYAGRSGAGVATFRHGFTLTYEDLHWDTFFSIDTNDLRRYTVEERIHTYPLTFPQPVRDQESLASGLAESDTPFYSHVSNDETHMGTMSSPLCRAMKAALQFAMRGAAAARGTHCGDTGDAGCDKQHCSNRRYTVQTHTHNPFPGSVSLCFFLSSLLNSHMC